MKSTKFLKMFVATVILTIGSLSQAHEFLPAKNKMAQRIDQWIVLLDWYEGNEPGNPKKMLEVGDVHYKKIKALVSRTPEFEDTTHDLLKALVADTDHDEATSCKDFYEDYYLVSILDDVRISIHESFVEIRFFGEDAAAIKEKFVQAKAVVAQITCKNAKLMKEQYRSMFDFSRLAK